MSDHEQAKAYEGWTILELMGHRRLGGYVTEVEVACFKMLRIDVPGETPGSIVATQFYSAAALYCMTPTTEEMARAAALRDQPEPVHRWELPKPEPTPNRRSHIADDEPEEEDLDDEEIPFHPGIPSRGVP
jgi:hypothetical protein